MAVGDITDGTRVSGYDEASDGEGELTIGAYWLDEAGVVWVVLPNGLLGNLKGWDVTEHDDGTISTAPSILMHKFELDNGTVHIPEWHGYLERGKLREV